MLLMQMQQGEIHRKSKGCKSYGIGRQLTLSLELGVT